MEADLWAHLANISGAYWPPQAPADVPLGISKFNAIIKSRGLNTIVREDKGLSLLLSERY